MATASVAPASPDVLRFLHQVVVDGRHAADFHHDPAAVATWLNLPLTDADIRQLAELTPEESLALLYRTRFRPDQLNIHPYIVTPLPTTALGCAVIVVGVVVAIVVSVAAASMLTTLLGAKQVDRETVIDYSADRERKV